MDKETEKEIEFLTEKLNKLTGDDPLTVSKRRLIREQINKLKGE